ncbi:hypothetical protein HKCCE2091_06990 [Rhodobacterales bacterium HKCCE2091]|nr:hypothetical protein [Rhodobacterales bacterium HKCCE2091]
MKWLAVFAALATVVAVALAYGVGSRDRRVEDTLPETGAVERILVLGTSLTARTDWPLALEAELRSCNPLVSVTTRARSGANSTWGLDALREALAEGAAPDLVLAEFSINDASPFRGMPLRLSRNRHEAMIDAAGAPVVFLTMSPAWGREALERPGQAAYRNLYRRLAEDGRAGLVDTVPDWRALSVAERRAMVPDGLHPTAEATIGVAVPRIAAALRPVFCP